MLALIFGWEIGVNAFLASPLAVLAFNADPSVVRIGYSRAYSVVPFVVHIEDFRLEVQDPFIQLHVSADSVSARLSVWTLVTRRFRASDIEGDGVTFWLRTRLAPEALTKADVAMLPPVPGFASVAAPPGPPVTLDLSKVVTVELLGMHVRHLRDVWINDHRFEGDIEVRGGFQYEPFQSLRLDRVSVTLQNGVLRARGQLLARFEVLSVEAALAQTDINTLSLAAEEGLFAKVTLDARIRDVSVLNTYLGEALPGRLLTSRARLELGVTLEHGRLHEGSSVRLSAPDVGLRLPRVDLTGTLTASLTAASEKLALTGAIEGVTASLRGEGAPVPMLTSATVYLRGDAPSTTLRELESLDLGLRLEGAKANDLSFVNTVAPLGTGLRVLRGRGALSGTFSLSGMTGRARGTIDVDAADVVLQHQGITLAGRAALRVKLVDLCLATGAVNLSGSTLTLDDVTLNVKGLKSKGFWLRLVADPLQLQPAAEPSMRASFALAAQNLRPVVEIIGASVPLPWVLKAVSDTGEVKASATVEARNGTIRVSALQLAAGRVTAEGDVRLVEIAQPSGPPVQRPFGAVFAKVSGVEVAISLEGVNTVPVLVEAKAWYRARQLAALDGGLP